MGAIGSDEDELCCPASGLTSYISIWDRFADIDGVSTFVDALKMVSVDGMRWSYGCLIYGENPTCRNDARAPSSQLAKHRRSYCAGRPPRSLDINFFIDDVLRDKAYLEVRII